MIEAENDRVALERLAEVHPKLILLDLMMPEMDGFKFLSELRGLGEHRSIPVVVVTGADLSDEDHRTLRGGVDRILSKAAYTREELLQEVRVLVAQFTEKDSVPEEQSVTW